MKPIVYYRGRAERRGCGGALLYPVNHTNHVPGQEVTNGRPAQTSTIVSWVVDRIETRNTIYLPEVLNAA